MSRWHIGSDGYGAGGGDGYGAAYDGDGYGYGDGGGGYGDGGDGVGGGYGDGYGDGCDGVGGGYGDGCGDGCDGVGGGYGDGCGGAFKQPIDDFRCTILLALNQQLQAFIQSIEPMKTAKLGEQIVVIDNGFVYVGSCSYCDGFLTIDDAKNIRKWGTSQGLGELARGPLPKTEADPTGTVVVPAGRVVLFIKCSGWL